MTYTIPTLNEYKARENYSISFGEELIYKARATGPNGNHISVALTERILRNTSLPEQTPEEPNPTPVINENIENYIINVSKNKDVSMTFSGLNNVQINPIILTDDFVCDISLTYDNGVFAIDGIEHSPMVPGEIYRSPELIFSIPLGNYNTGDKFTLIVKNIIETFSAPTLTELKNTVSMNSKLISLHTEKDAGDLIVLNTISSQIPQITETIEIIDVDNERIIKEYSRIYLKGGAGLPSDYSHINTGPIKLVHINYSEAESELLVNKNKIFKYDVSLKRLVENS